MIKFKLRYCRVQMARYVTGDLSDGARRRVARYIDECEACYREYMRHRDFTLKLERNLPLIGRADAATLDKVWMRLSAEVADAPRPTSRLRDFRTTAGANFSYGLALVALAVVLLVPLMLGSHRSVLAVDLPQIPMLAEHANTPSTEDTLTTDPLATASAQSDQTWPVLQNTPEPRF